MLKRSEAAGCFQAHPIQYEESAVPEVPYTCLPLRHVPPTQRFSLVAQVQVALARPWVVDQFPGFCTNQEGCRHLALAAWSVPASVIAQHTHRLNAGILQAQEAFLHRATYHVGSLVCWVSLAACPRTSFWCICCHKGVLSCLQPAAHSRPGTCWERALGLLKEKGGGPARQAQNPPRLPACRASR